MEVLLEGKSLFVKNGDNLIYELNGVDSFDCPAMTTDLSLELVGGFDGEHGWKPKCCFGADSEIGVRWRFMEEGMTEALKKDGFEVLGKFDGLKDENLKDFIERVNEGRDFDFDKFAEGFGELEKKLTVAEPNLWHGFSDVWANLQVWALDNGFEAVVCLSDGTAERGCFMFLTKKVEFTVEDLCTPRDKCNAVKDCYNELKAVYDKLTDGITEEGLKKLGFWRE